MYQTKGIEFDPDKHEYRVNGERKPSVSELIDPLTARHYGEISKEMLTAAANRGTAVHSACEDIDYGLEVEVPAEYAGYCEAYVAFLNDYRPELLAAEMRFYQPEYGYCGTLDRWFVVDGEEWLLDIKTTSSPSKANIVAGCVQTRAYQLAVESAKRRFLLYLKSDGKYRLVDCGEYEKKHNFSATSIFGHLTDLYEELERKWK